MKKFGQIGFNIFWVLFVGLETAVVNAVYGAPCCVTVVGIPLGLQHFKFIKLAFAPAGRNVATRFSRHPLMNTLYILFGGGVLVVAVFSDFPLFISPAQELGFFETIFSFVALNWPQLLACSGACVLFYEAGELFFDCRLAKAYRKHLSTAFDLYPDTEPITIKSHLYGIPLDRLPAALGVIASKGQEKI